MLRRYFFIICLGVIVCFGVGSASAEIINGDFSSTVVFNNNLGWESSDDFDIYPSVNVEVKEGEAIISTNDGHLNYLSTLFQWIEIPSWAYTFSFDVSFMTEEDGSKISEDEYLPDWFEAYFLDDYDEDYDQLFMGYDIMGPYDLTTFASIGLEDLGGGVYQYKTFIDSVAGRIGTLYFDLNDQPDGFSSKVIIDNVQFNERQSNPIPEPKTILLIAAGLACFVGMRARHKKNLPA